MRRSSGLLWVGVASVLLLAGCTGSQVGRWRPDFDAVQVEFVQPDGAKVSVANLRGDAAWSPPLTIPGRIDFEGGRTYHIRLTDVPNQPGLTVWGRLTVEDATQYTVDCAVPLEITRDDIEDAKRNILVVKVVFLPDEEHAVYAIPGAPTSIVSTRLEPGKDPVKEAKKQGTVLLVLRLGGRDQGQ